MEKHQSKVLIIGSGPAGYTAGIYAARAGLEPIMVSGSQPGGQLTLTTNIENFPGFANSTDGNALMLAMREQALNLGVKIIEDTITEVNFAQKPFICKSESKEFQADSVIISTGASARWLGLESEEKFRGFGISSCATCDGFFYRNKEVVVIGGGNTAVEDALLLSKFAKHVTLIHRRDSLRADAASQKRLFANEKISVIWDSVVTEFLGTEQHRSLTGIMVKNIKTNEVKEMKIDGVFVAVGNHPNTELFKGQLDLSDEGYIITAPDSTKTSIEGVFAAGDVRFGNYRQAIVAAGSGCIASLEAEKFLQEK